jgi:hypothetical protein
MTPCEEVTERLALGEPLGDAEDHVATCPACSRLIALPRLVAASAHAAEPHAGFVIRSTTGARTMPRSGAATHRRQRPAAAAAIVLGCGRSTAPSPSTKCCNPDAYPTQNPASH